MRETDDQGALRRALDWAFRDRRTGRIVVGQFPNLALACFLVAKLAEWLLPPGRWQDGAALLALAALLVWAADELLRGVNPWRRALGVGVLVYLLASRLG